MKAHQAIGEQEKEMKQVISKICEIGKELESVEVFLNVLLNIATDICVFYEVPEEDFLDGCKTMFRKQKDNGMSKKENHESI